MTDYSKQYGKGAERVKQLEHELTRITGALQVANQKIAKFDAIVVMHNEKMKEKDDMIKTLRNGAPACESCEMQQEVDNLQALLDLANAELAEQKLTNEFKCGQVDALETALRIIAEATCKL